MPYGRFRKRSIPLIIVAVILILTLRNRLAFDGRPTYATKPPSVSEHGLFWSAFHDVLDAANPNCNSPTRPERQPEAIGFRPDEVDNVKLPEQIVVENEDVQALKKAHKRFASLLSGPSAPKLVYQPGTRGIVSTAGGSQLPVLVTSLHMLRRTGSNLPFELFVADQSEYDDFICETLLPTLNARCIILDEILKYSPLAEGLKKYQFKIVSLMFSSFEDVLFLDADAFPMHDPSRLFTSEPFRSKGLITWPDFWQVTYHPSFFEVSSQQVPTSFRHASTESGQILVSKRSHGQMLLLSAYYNFYGPSHYYPLLSQGHPGEGDKETFVPPALILDLPFYAVSTGPAVFGYVKPSGEWQGGVIMQADPIWDSKLPKGKVYGWHDKPSAPADSFFSIHANLPKLDPVQVFGEGGLAWTADGKPKRMWCTKQEIFEKVGFDIEKELWKELKTTACELEGRYAPWKDVEICGTIKQFLIDMADK